jgi:hypothetical protein
MVQARASRTEPWAGSGTRAATSTAAAQCRGGARGATGAPAAARRLPACPSDGPLGLDRRAAGHSGPAQSPGWLCAAGQEPTATSPRSHRQDEWSPSLEIAYLKTRIEADALATRHLRKGVQTSGLGDVSAPLFFERAISRGCYALWFR